MPSTLSQPNPDVKGLPAVADVVEFMLPSVLVELRSYLEGVGSAAAFDNPYSVSYDPVTRSLFVLDAGNFVIRRIQ